MKFQLHSRLEADTFTLGDLKISRLLLMNDSRYPWVILVPRQMDLTEIHQLEPQEQIGLMEEISQLSQLLERDFPADKINVGALGNLVPQLHIHIIARQKNDPAWPGPVWGQGSAIPYGPEKEEILNKFQHLPFLDR